MRVRLRENSCWLTRPSSNLVIKANDTQTLIKGAIDDHQKVTEEQLDSSVQEAFATGLFTVLEIVFDKQHRRAVAGYSFVCGMLCGGGDVLILRKNGSRWRNSQEMRWMGLLKALQSLSFTPGKECC
jgi:hypothetical protein